MSFEISVIIEISSSYYMSFFTFFVCFLYTFGGYYLLRMFYHTLLIFYLFIFVAEAEYTSPSDVDMIRETSNSILSPEHQQLPLNVASRISNLTSVLDSQDLEGKDEGIFENNSIVILVGKRKFPYSRIHQPN